MNIWIFSHSESVMKGHRQKLIIFLPNLESSCYTVRLLTTAKINEFIYIYIFSVCVCLCVCMREHVCTVYICRHNWQGGIKAFLSSFAQKHMTDLYHSKICTFSKMLVTISAKFTTFFFFFLQLSSAQQYWCHTVSPVVQ